MWRRATTYSRMPLKPPVGNRATSLADAELPDPGQDSIVSTAAVIGTLLGGLYGILRGTSVERGALLGGLAGAGTGLVLYLGALIGSVV